MSYHCISHLTATAREGGKPGNLETITLPRVLLPLKKLSMAESQIEEPDEMVLTISIPLAHSLSLARSAASLVQTLKSAVALEQPLNVMMSQ